jgi:hypothetical protein
MVLASCGDKYYRTNFISVGPSSLLIAPGLRTIQFLLPMRSQNITYLFYLLNGVREKLTQGIYSKTNFLIENRTFSLYKS